MQKRKVVPVVTLLVFLLTSLVLPVHADVTGGSSVLVNNTIVPGSAAPVYSNGTLLVPAREFVQALGGTFTSDTVKGTAKLGENELVFRLDNSVVKYNGKNIQAPAPMKISGYRYMVPAEFTAKYLGAEVYTHTYKNAFMAFQPVNGKLTYSVMPGDTLWMIASVFGTTIPSIRQLNGITTDMLYVGQKIVIKDFSPVTNPVQAKTTANATLWVSPSFNASVVGYLLSGVDVSITGKSGDWYKARTPKGDGYLYYTVVGVKQDTSDSAPDSTYFSKEIPVDTSKNYITYGTYTVKKGDSIWSISQNVGIPDVELAQANNMSATTVLYVGQVLKLPIHNVPVKSTPGAAYGEVLDWFKEANYVFPIGKTGKVIDLETGKSFTIKRTMGANHADCETPTSQDTQIMKQIFGGTWGWNRRPFILEVDGRRLAVSIAGMPHAGVDGAAYLKDVANRSDNWGYGPNYDSIAGNGMDGHFDVYFLNCLRHVDNQIDPAHQYQVLTAGGLR